MSYTGKFIVLEGTDGSGKTTQLQLLHTQLQQAGYDVATFDFPRYDQPSSYFVREYLHGEYGTVDEVGPYTASLFYALDRYEAASEIREALKQGKIVISNRFTASSMAHQGAKFLHAEERRGYFIWLDNLEFLLLKIPRPDVNFVLRVPAETAQMHIDQNAAQSNAETQRSALEADLNHTQNSVQAYDDLCSLFPQDFQRIDCIRSGQLMAIEDIQKIVWEKVSAILPKIEPTKSAKQAPTKAKPKRIETATVNPTKHINLSLYAQMILARQRVAIEAKPQDFTQKDIQNQYHYYTPDTLSPELTSQYKDAMDSIFELHTEMHYRLKAYLQKTSDPNRDTVVHDILKDALPLAAQTQTTISLNTACHSSLHELAEITSMSNSTQNEVAQLAPRLLKEKYSTMKNNITLTNLWPRNELDILPDVLYPFSGMSLYDIRTAVAEWKYEQKTAVLIAYLTEQNREIAPLESIRYQFDIASKVSALQQLLYSKVSATWQELTPRYGYDMPKLLEDAELSELYERCFDISLELHSALQAAGHLQESSYAVLSGHRARWQLNVSASELLQQMTADIGDVPLLQDLQETIATRHAIIGEFLKHIKR